MSARAQLVPSPLVRSAVHGDRAILLDLKRERYYGLNEVATRIWTLLREGADVSEIVERLGAEYEVPGDDLRADVAAMLSHLSRLGVVVPGGIESKGSLVAPARGAVPDGSGGPLQAPSGWMCAATLACVAVTLRVVGLRRTIALVHRLSRRPAAAESPSYEFLADAVRKVDMAAAFFPGRALCLEQSMALYACLRRAGVPVKLQIGVQPYPFAAHAWVEHQGELVGDSYDRVGKFVPFDNLEML